MQDHLKLLQMSHNLNGSICLLLQVASKFYGELINLTGQSVQITDDKRDIIKFPIAFWVPLGSQKDVKHIITPNCCTLTMRHV